MDKKNMDPLEQQLYASNERLEASMPPVDVEKVKHAVAMKNARRLKEKRQVRINNRSWYLGAAAVITLLLISNVVLTFLRPDIYDTGDEPIATDRIMEDNQGLYYVNYYPDNKGEDNNILALFMRQEENRQPEVIHSQFVQHADGIMSMQQMPIQDSRYLLLSAYQSVNATSSEGDYQHVVFIFDKGRMEPLMEIEGYVAMMEDNRFESEQMGMTIIPVLMNETGIYSKATSVSIQVGEQLCLLLNGEKEDIVMGYDSSVIVENTSEESHILMLEGKEAGNTTLTLTGHGIPQSLDVRVQEDAPRIE